MAQYNTAPPTGPSQAGLAAGALIAIAQRLERLEASLGR